MPLAKCVRCERLFTKVEDPVCPTCAPDEEKDHELVRACLNEHPDSNAEMVAELTGVSLQCVVRMVEQGMVASIGETGLSAKCGKCGAPAISVSKRLCSSCLEEMNKNIAKQRNTLRDVARKDVQVGEYLNVRQAIDSKRR